MKEIIVVSDNHGRKYLLDEIVKKHPNAEAYIHCGDSEDLASNLYPFITVKGNNDYYIDNLSSIVKINNFKAYVTHGHKILLTSNKMIKIAKENNCNFFIHGHTHRPYIEKKDDVYMLCPGSLSYPRSSMGQTYAIISSNDDFINHFEVEIVLY